MKLFEKSLFTKVNAGFEIIFALLIREANFFHPRGKKKTLLPYLETHTMFESSVSESKLCYMLRNVINPGIC